MVTYSVRSGVQRYELSIPAEDSIARHLARGRPYEAALLRVIRRLRPGLVLDVGAHVGNHAVNLAAHGIDVVAVEPNPAALEYLRMNVADLPVRVVEGACGAMPGHVSVNSGPDLGTSRVTDGGPIRRLKVDDLGLEPDVIKIDVEGRELEVLQGALTTIQETRPVLVVEAHAGPDSVASLLRPFDYEQRGGSLAHSPTYLFATEDVPTIVAIESARMALWRFAAKITRQLGVRR